MQQKAVYRVGLGNLAKFPAKMFDATTTSDFWPVCKAENPTNVTPPRPYFRTL